MGTGIAWKMRNQSKADFLSGNGTQTGQEIPSYKMLVGDDKATFCPPPLTDISIFSSNYREHKLTTITAFPLALNFIASGE